MKYVTVKVGGVIIQIAETTNVKGYTIGVIETFFPEYSLKLSKKESNEWISQNNKRMEAICNFLNESKL